MSNEIFHTDHSITVSDCSIRVSQSQFIFMLIMLQNCIKMHNSYTPTSESKELSAGTVNSLALRNLKKLKQNTTWSMVWTLLYSPKPHQLHPQKVYCRWFNYDLKGLIKSSVTFRNLTVDERILTVQCCRLQSARWATKQRRTDSDAGVGSNMQIWQLGISTKLYIPILCTAVGATSRVS